MGTSWFTRETVAAARRRLWNCGKGLLLAVPLLSAAPAIADDFFDPTADRDALPHVPEGFEVTMFAREPLVRQPCSMAFDAKGRLYVGMGPQYRNPKPNTPGDSVVIVSDKNGDGIADETKVFATGFNAIQGMAWHGRDLWVANAPDLTVVRDLDGDDEADEYVMLYTDLGNLEHGLHGLNWAPDGRLYMSKGNAKGLTLPGRVAPKPFLELWGVTAPEGTPDFPPPKTFTKETYRHTYHDPADDWGLEGGVLRCDDGGTNLEIISRGFRNPWDITMDDTFNWLGTDNDQTLGDRVFMPFPTAHFGWNHPWSTHLTDAPHLPTAPSSGPLFEGSGTGMIYGNALQFPPEYRNVFFINDWLRKTTFIWKPEWDGALMRPAGGDWEPFVEGRNSLFRPTDMEIGPDGALWILGWSASYGVVYKNGEMSNEGRVFRVAWKGATPPKETAPRDQPLQAWTVSQLVNEFDSPLPVRRIDAQDELVRRGLTIQGELKELLNRKEQSRALQTWTIWTLGRIAPTDASLTKYFETFLQPGTKSDFNLQLQAIRILADRVVRTGEEQPLPDVVLAQLKSPEPRLRAAAVFAVWETRQVAAESQLLDLLSSEQDTITFYSAWQTLRLLVSTDRLKSLLEDSRGGVRLGAFLALLETHALDVPLVTAFSSDQDERVREVAALWLSKSADGSNVLQVRGKPVDNVPSAPSSSKAKLLRKLKTGSGQKYRFVSDGLKAGTEPFIDRKYTLKSIPKELEGAEFIRTANDDDGSRGPDFLTFESLLPVRVWVGFDTRMKSLPAWAAEFTPVEGTARGHDWEYRFVTRDFPAGRISLGGNTDDGKEGGKCQYLVAVKPTPLPTYPAAPTVDETLALLEKADPQRGEILFAHTGGAGCFRCHSLDEKQNGFGPNLAGIGQRSSPLHIAQSIIDPNAVITEGFNLQQILTDDGLMHAGVLLEESGLTVTLGLPTGEAVRINKKSIESRQSAKISAMPPLGTTLTAAQVADLTAFLMTQKAAPKSKKATATTAPVAPAKAKEPATAMVRRTDSSNDEAPPAPVEERGLGAQLQDDRIRLTLDGAPIGEFVYQDKLIRRPYFINIRLPGGPQLTRNFPPVKGQDPTDHADMHPGVWLGFGDINSQDFWRNRGRIEHDKISQPPTVSGNELSFVTVGKLVSDSGEPICRMENRIRIQAADGGWRLNWNAVFFADQHELKFGDQEEMGFGVRVATPISEKKGGHLLSSEGGQSAKAIWGKPAKWCDYSGTIDGKPCGVTLLTGPGNFRKSWWHVRDYGLAVANPFGQAAMKQGEKSEIVVPRGDSLELEFAAVFHSGSQYDPAQAYADFVASEKKKP
ncbi:PVC-type heme-binding CxxCH protein [Planctomicrobium sp. SH664]|uniref:PVC-type heme-binding CxxCH protein n=1 Tax=Planctomicrobium sp. SH664 TaxID=3448125 RepID=UPI003F5B3044